VVRDVQGEGKNIGQKGMRGEREVKTEGMSEVVAHYWPQTLLTLA
jgi:hypothetical protein